MLDLFLEDETFSLEVVIQLATEYLNSTKDKNDVDDDAQDDGRWKMIDVIYKKALEKNIFARLD